jgi:hypothetical protein
MKGEKETRSFGVFRFNTHTVLVCSASIHTQFWCAPLQYTHSFGVYQYHKIKERTMINSSLNAFRKALTTGFVVSNVLGLMASQASADTASIDSFTVTKIFVTYQGQQTWQSTEVAYFASASTTATPTSTRMVHSFVSYGGGNSIVGGTDVTNGVSAGTTSYLVNRTGTTQPGNTVYTAKIFVAIQNGQQGQVITASATQAKSP